MTMFEILTTAGLPVAYSHFKTAQNVPYIVYIGTGQHNLSADNTYIWGENEYQIEYYYKEKNEEAEVAIESALLSAGYQYEKSEDIFIEDRGVFVIYYTI